MLLGCTTRGSRLTGNGVARVRLGHPGTYLCVHAQASPPSMYDINTEPDPRVRARKREELAQYLRSNWEKQVGGLSVRGRG